MNTVQIVAASNNLYVPFLSVMLQSVMDFSSPERNYSVTVLHTDIEEQNRKTLFQMMRNNFRMEFINVSKRMQNYTSLFVSNHIKIETYFRLLLPELMPETEKVLYIDCDVIANQDVAELYDINTDGYLLAAARDADSAANYNTHTEDKDYIETIYLQNGESEELYEIKDKNVTFSNGINDINVYLKFTNINRTCRYCNDIITTLNLTYDDVIENCDINEKLLNVHGIMDISIVTLYGEDVTISAGVNLSYIIDILILLILIIFSVLFIIILYNAFLITVNERRQEYAILNSIGATKGQITTMIFKETTIVGIIGILIGGLLSILGTDIILKIINNILVDTIYNFEISIKIQYLVLLILIVILNIYISAIIPSIEASNTSVIQGIKNNKHIKSKKKRGVIESILPVEGRIALKNLNYIPLYHLNLLIL